MENNNANVDQIRFDTSNLEFHLYLSMYGEQTRIPISHNTAIGIIENQERKHGIEVGKDCEYIFWVFNPAKAIPFEGNIIKG